MIAPYNGKPVDETLFYVYLFGVLFFTLTPLIMLCIWCLSCVICNWCVEYGLQGSSKELSSSERNNPFSNENLNNVATVEHTLGIINHVDIQGT